MATSVDRVRLFPRDDARGGAILGAIASVDQDAADRAPPTRSGARTSKYGSFRRSQRRVTIAAWAPTLSFYRAHSGDEVDLVLDRGETSSSSKRSLRRLSPAIFLDALKRFDETVNGALEHAETDPALVA
jgi:hypothetical protein